MDLRLGLRPRGFGAGARGAITGSLGSLVSTALLVPLSRAATGHPAAATNATSHWVWAARAFTQDRASLRYTATGYLIHHAASVWWGVISEGAIGARGHRRVLRDALVTAGVACFVDYVVCPKRLTPGYEEHLSPAAVGLSYLAFAAGLAAGMRWLGPPRRSIAAPARREVRSRPGATAASRSTRNGG